MSEYVVGRLNDRKFSGGGFAYKVLADFQEWQPPKFCGGAKGRGDPYRPPLPLP